MAKRRKKSYIEKITPFIDRMRSNYQPEDWDEPLPPSPEDDPVIDPTTNSLENVDVDLSKNAVLVNEVDIDNHAIIL